MSVVSQVRKVRGAMRRLVRHNAAADQPPYVVVYEARLKASPDELPIRRFDGLLCCQVLRPEGRSSDATPSAAPPNTVYTVWTSQSRFEAAGSDFQQWLRERQSTGSLDVNVLTQGVQQRIAGGMSSYWTWAWLAIVHIGAVAGAVEVLRNHYAWALVQPSLALAAPTKFHEFHRDDRLDLDLHLRNLTRIGLCRVEVDRVALRPFADEAGGSNDRRPDIELLGWEEPILFQMAPNDVTRLEHNWPNIPPGLYTVLVEGRKKGGWFIRERPFTFRTQRLRVWDDIATGPLRVTEISDEGRATLSGTISVGRPMKPLNVLVTLPRMDVEVLLIVSSRQAAPIIPEQQADHWRARWRTEPITTRREVSIRMELELRAASPQHGENPQQFWDDVAGSVDVHVRPNE